MLVREQQVASDASAFTYDLTKGADVLVVDVTGLPGTTSDDLEAAVAALIDDVHEGGVTEAEVARAAALIETELVSSLQSAGDRADRLSMFTTYFDEPELVNVQPELYRAVTTEDVTRFVRARLGRDNRASLLYVPRAAVADESPAVAEAQA